MRNRENSGAATALAESTTQVKGVSRMASAALVLHTAVFIPSCIRWSKERQLKAFKALGLKHPEAQHAVTRSAVTRAQSMLQDVARCSFACKRSHVCKVHKNLQENHCQNAINWQLSARISSPARVSTPPKSNSDQNVLSVRWKFPSTFVTKIHQIYPRLFWLSLSLMVSGRKSGFKVSEVIRLDGWLSLCLFELIYWQTYISFNECKLSSRSLHVVTFQ
jgi:hypothetical protein